MASNIFRPIKIYNGVDWDKVIPCNPRSITYKASTSAISENSGWIFFGSTGTRDQGYDDDASFSEIVVSDKTRIKILEAGLYSVNFFARIECGNATQSGCTVSCNLVRNSVFQDVLHGGGFSYGQGVVLAQLHGTVLLQDQDEIVFYYAVSGGGNTTTKDNGTSLILTKLGEKV